RRGNRHRRLAPHAVYPCAGDDRWVAIAVRDEEEWARFCQVAGHPEWRCDPRFQGMASRYQHQEELDRLIAGWTSGCDPRAVLERLQAAGVPAGIVQTARDLLLDPQLRERGFYQIVDHPAAPRVGRRPIQGCPFMLTATPPRIRKPSPALGEDNARILGGLLGLSPDELAALEREGVIGRTPDPSQPMRVPDVLPLEEQRALGIIRDYDLEYRETLERAFSRQQSGDGMNHKEHKGRKERSRRRN